MIAIAIIAIMKGMHNARRWIDGKQNWHGLFVCLMVVVASGTGTNGYKNRPPCTSTHCTLPY
jgi:hypothetical protein